MTLPPPLAPPLESSTLSGLARWGQWCATRPWRVLVTWLIVLAACSSLASSLHATFSDNVTLTGTQAYVGQSALIANEPSTAASTGLIVFTSASPLSAQASVLTTATTALAGVEHVTSVSRALSSATTSRDGRTSYVTLGFDVASRALTHRVVTQLDAALAPVRAHGVHVAYGGGLDIVTQPSVNDHASEIVGVVVALIVLLVIFGSVVGALVPLLAALVAIAAGLSLLNIVAVRIAFGASAPKLAAMIGIGVGIDYAVFLTTRFRQLLRDGESPARAAGLTTATSGRAVLVAATTVSIAMVGLYASGVTFIGQLGLGAVFGVITAAAGAVTLVPAVLGLVGPRIDRWHLGRVVAETGTSGDGWHRYAGAIGRHPWRYLTSGVVVVAVVALPAIFLQTGHVGDGASPSSYTSRQAYDALARAFGPGVNASMTLVLTRTSPSSTSSAAESNLTATLARSAGVAHVSAWSPSANGRIVVANLVPATGPQDARTAALYTHLVTTVLPQGLAGTGDRGYVTGPTAFQIQFDQLIGSRLPLIIAVVAVLALVLILSVFRSVYLALKAALLNLLSIAAAYGVLVAVFQWGWGRSLLGLRENVPVEAYVPMLLFAIIFGLSMDYEIFLLSRVKETWDRTHDNHLSVADGLARTGRVITAAALIMVSVFLSFVTTDLVAIKQLAVGLAASVAIDATLIRLLLVPATMFLFGERNWWLPRWLDRIIPHLSVD